MIEPFRTTLGLTTGTCGCRCIKEPSPCLFSSLWRPSGPACRYTQKTEYTVFSFLKAADKSRNPRSHWGTSFRTLAALKLHWLSVSVLCVSVFAGEPGQRRENFPELLLSVETVWRSAWVLQHPPGLHCGQERGIPTETRSVPQLTPNFKAANYVVSLYKRYGRVVLTVIGFFK